MLYCKPFLETSSYSNHAYKICVIENSIKFNKALCNELQKYDKYFLTSTYTFQEAIQYLQKESYDFIILNLDLPDGFGEELIETLQQLSNAKIIILANEMDVQVRETLFKKKILDYIIKDENFFHSIKSINSLIQKIENNTNFTVLVLDDSKFMCQQLRSLLEVRNYNVITALNAESGYKAIQENNINAIILDMELPDRHGLELLRDIKENQEYCHIPIIVLSGTNDPEIVRNALKTGADDFVHKPFNIEEMMLKIDMAVETNQKYIQLLCTQKTLQEYKEAIDSSSLVSKTNLKGIITYVNDAFCFLSGFTKEELIGAPHSIVRHPDMPSEVFKEMWATIKSNKVWKGNIKNRKKNGESYYVKTTINPILDANDNIVEYIAIRTDITNEERYKEILEQDLQVANNNMYYLTQIEEAMQKFVALIKTNDKGTIIYANDNFLKASGYKLNEILGKKCHTIRSQKHIIQKDCEKVAEELQKTKTVHMLFENIKKSGEIFYADTTIYPLADKTGKINEHLHLMYDVTELIKIHEELEKTQKDIIYTMGEIGESRSKETGNHVKRVAEYSRLLALYAGMDKKEADMLFAASPMHDIGKVAIPDAILNKPGRHTPEEFEIMKTHAQIGYEVLKNSKRPILQTAALVAYTHHEKYDGSGYPRGLKAEDIPLCGRITAVADVFDALGSDRTYKKAWPLEKILTLFKEEKGKHFDPKLIDIFFDNLDQFLAIKEKFKD